MRTQIQDEDRGQGWNDASTSQGTPRVPCHHQKPGEQGGSYSPDLEQHGDSLGITTTDPLISDF